jgi:hypothetical protein
MAVVNPTFLREGDRTIIVTWAALATGDTGAPVGVDLLDFADRSIQWSGTFGGATATWQGSNDGTNYLPLTDGNGTALAVTVVDLQQIYEVTRLQRPSVAGGAGVAITATMFARRSVSGKGV